MNAPLAVPPQPQKQSRSRRFRIVRGALHAFAALCVIVLIVVGVSAWLLGRQTTLQRIVAYAERSLQGQLVVTGVTGSLYDRVAFDRLVFRSETQTVTVERGSLRYTLMPLARTLLIADMRAATITVETIAKSDEPTMEPETLALPAALRLDTLRLDALRVDTIRIVQKDSTIELKNAEARARYEGKRWIVERVALTSPWGALSGRAALAATRPFALEADVLAEGRAFDVPYRAPLAVRGRLADLSLASDFTIVDRTSQSMAGNASAHVLPFRDQPLERAGLHIAGVSPKRWKADLPEADLAIDADLEPVGGLRDAALDSAGSYPFRGSVRLVNALPGTIDRSRIPLAALQANLAGDSTRVDLSDIVADLGTAGRATGKGSYEFSNGGIPSLEVTVRALDLRAIHGKLIASRFAGPLSVRRQEGVLHLDAALTEPGRSVRVKAEQEGDEIRIADAVVGLGASRVAAKGRINLAGQRVFALTGTTDHLNPRDFGDFPTADLNTQFKLDGALGSATASARAPGRRVTADIKLAPSRVMERPIAGSVAGSFSGTPDAPDVKNADIALAFGTNRVTARGDFGQPRDRLAWSVDAPRLAELGVGVAGRLKGQGSAAGTLASPAIDFALTGDDLRYKKRSAQAASSSAADAVSYSLKSLRANGRLLAGASGALDANIAIAELRDGSTAGTPLLAKAEAKVSGTRDAHTLTIAATSSRFDVSAAAHGGLDAKNAWRGVIDTLQSRGRVPFATEGSAPLVVSTERVELGRAVLKFTDGRVDLERLVYADGQVDTAGKASSFPLALAGTFSRDFARQVRTSLKFGGEWDLRIGNAIDGKVHLFRESGDIQFLTEPRFSLDVENLDVRADIVANQVTAKVAAAGRGLGRVAASVEARLSKRDGSWGVAGDAPLALTSDVDIPDMRWLARLSGRPGLDLSGMLRVAMTGRGTIAHPLLSGSANGASIALRWPDQGLNFRDGRFDADLEGDRVVLKQATLASGNGRMEASGNLRLADKIVTGALDVKLDRFEALSRSDRTIVVSGSGAARFGASGIDVTADLKADRGVLQLAEKRGPTLSDDIVIIGRPREDEVEPKSLPVRFSVKFDMGDDFNVKGSGFDGKLGGVIQIAGSGGALRAIGTVGVREGTYVAYGQRLTIDRGNLTFSGPIDNPGLDILAVRKNLAVEAGVRITGTALSPQARLTSNPNVPDTEKLSWLILGHGLDASSKSDYGVLTTAAASLLGSSESAGLQSRIAATLGVDEVGVSGLGGEKGGLLTIGKQISSRLRVSFEQGFTKAATLLKIRYNIYKRVDLQVQTGTESAVDVFYTFSFD